MADGIDDTPRGDFGDESCHVASLGRRRDHLDRHHIVVGVDVDVVGAIALFDIRKRVGFLQDISIMDSILCGVQEGAFTVSAKRLCPIFGNLSVTGGTEEGKRLMRATC